MSDKEAESLNSSQRFEDVETALRTLSLDELRRLVEFMESLEGTPWNTASEALYDRIGFNGILDA